MGLHRKTENTGRPKPKVSRNTGTRYKPWLQKRTVRGFIIEDLYRKNISQRTRELLTMNRKPVEINKRTYNWAGPSKGTPE